MTGDLTFIERFVEFVGASGWRTTASPAQLVNQWGDFVRACEEGYASTLYEFENERSVRDLLERALNDPVLRTFDEMDEIRGSIESIDERFRQTCRDDVTIGRPDAPWWRRCVPRLAEGEFSEDLHPHYGIEPL